MLTIQELGALADAGEVDTVLVVFPDLQGRFMGKRVRADFFCRELPVNGGTVEACNYLLAVDVDMTVLDGFRYATWENGYGDFECVPDLTTLRLVPWLERTALDEHQFVRIHRSAISTERLASSHRPIERMSLFAC